MKRLRSCILLILLMVCFPRMMLADLFTLSDIESYAQTLPEFPEDEYVNPYKPRHTKLHKQLHETQTYNLRNRDQLTPDTIVHDVQKWLRDITNDRELQALYGDFVHKFFVDVQTRWFIWGSLHGAFHSLVRGLNELKSQGIINNDLKVQSERYYLVFNGNSLNYGPYQLETLFVILLLLKQNPEQVYLVKGAVEDKHAWTQTNLVHELQARIESDRSIPLQATLNSFFKTLPLALYLVSTEQNVLRISFFKQHSLLQENEWGLFLQRKNTEHKKITQIIPSKTEAEISAYLTSHTVKEYPYAIEPLTYEQIDDVHTWSIFSSPLRLFDAMFDYHSDAFLVLITGKFFSSWHVDLYTQHIKDKMGFIRASSYNVATGKEVFTANQKEHIEDLRQKIELAQLERKRLKEQCEEREPVQEKEPALEPEVQEPAPEKEAAAKGGMAQQGNKLIIGTMQDLSKSLKDLGLPFQKGLRLPIEDVNQKGGVHGLQVDLVSLDDQYNPELTRELVERLRDEYRTDVLLGAQGTPTLAAYLDLIKKKEILSVFPYTGAYDELALDYLLKLRASYFDVGYVLTRFMIEKDNKVRLAFLYQNDHFGKSNLEGAQRALKEAGIQDYLAVSYEAHEPKITQQAEQIEAFKPDAIGLFGVPFYSEKLIESLSTRVLMDKDLFANEFHGRQAFRSFVQEQGLRLTVAHVLPDPHNSQLQIAQEYRKAVELQNIEIDESGFEGYVTAALFVDQLQKMSFPFTKDGFVAQIESIKDYNFKGLELSFEPKTRQVFKTIWINNGSSEWIKQEPTPIAPESDQQPQEEPEAEPEPTPLKEPKVEEPKVQPESQQGQEKQPAEEPTQQEPEKAPTQPVQEIALQNNVLVLGNSSDFSKTLKKWCKFLQKGLMLPINALNEQDGINGMKLRVVFLDDGYDPERARENIQKFLEDFKTDILLGAHGTPTLKGYLDMVKDGTITTIFPNTSSYRDESLKHILHWRASNHGMGKAVTQFVHQQKKAKRFAFIYQDDPFGRQLLEGAQNYVTEQGIDTLIALPHERHASDFSEIIEKLETFKPDAIGLFTVSRPAEIIVKEVGAHFLMDKTLFGSEVIDPGQTFFKERGITPIIPSVVPDPKQSTLPIAQAFRQDTKNTDVPVNVATFEGYINGSLFIDLIKKIEGPFSKQAFWDVVRSIKEYNFKGLSLHFNPETRQLMNTIWLNDGTQNWKKIDLNE